MPLDQRSLQLLVFRDAPPSLAQESIRCLERDPSTQFLCLVEPDASSAGVRKTWEFSVQPLFPSAVLIILRTPAGRIAETIADYAQELVGPSTRDLDLLYLSDAKAFRETKMLESWLKSLTARVRAQVPNCLVRRV